MKKKRFAALLLAGALLVQPCGALAAEKEETGSDAAVRQTAGNDFAEDQADAIHAPSLAAYSSSDDCVQIGIEGTYYTETKETILNRINEIRYEACEEGVQNPRTGEPLTKADYVPIRWSSDLEEIARQRAAEASVVQEHTRLDGSLCFTCTSTGGESTWAENLAWNWSGMMRGIEQWYEEKEDWVAQDSSAVTGHYTALISPSYYYIGLGTFQQAGAGWYTVTAEFSWKTEMDESKSSQSGTCVQPMSVTRDLLSNAAIQGAAHMKENESGKLSLTAEIDNFSTGVILSGVTWTTSAPNIVSVSSDGTIEALSGGTATITATVNDELHAEANITVDHLWDSGSVTREPTETKEGIKTYCCTGCGATKTESIPKLVAVTGISLNKGTLSLVKGSTDMLTATITPSNAANKTVTWTTSNSKIATVSNGKVTAVAAGTATITAKSNNGKTATCKVTVVNPTVAVTGIKLNKTALTLNPKGTATLKVTITPSNAT
ncbi:MAG TPA: hypothetical protein DDX51_00970, partial [Clostridiales bacterium]|nr:hypothetical protein [Clostridiales bacterium]